MKKFFYAIILSLLIFNVGVAQNSTKTQAVKDRLQTISEKFDSIAAEKGAFVDSVNSRMSDTVLSLKTPTQTVTMSTDYPQQSEESLYELIVVILAITVPVVAVVLITFICLIIGYKRRKAKYRIIELAIENNYALPEYLFNEKGGSAPIIQTAVMGQSTPQPNMRPTQQHNNCDQRSNVNSVISLQNAIKWTAIGLGLCLFFLFSDVLPMVGICSIILFIGVSKLVIAYNQNKYNNQQFNEQKCYPQNREEQRQAPIMPPPLPSEAKKDCNNTNNTEN